MIFHPYRTHADHRRAGSYDIVPPLPGDFNFTIHEPGVIPKELHMHKKQTDYFAVVKGKVLFHLVHPSGKEEKFIMTERDHKTLEIPPKIWHGYLALVPSIMVFYLTQKYNPKDEFRKKCKPSDWNLPKK